MQGNHEQQAYDRGITIFSPDGRLYQVEYAREAVKRGSASVGVRTPEGVVLAADRRARSPLMEEESIEKIHGVDDHIALASAGHVADARKLIDFARRRAQVENLRYDESIGVETLTKAVTDHIQEYTQTGGARPFGVALLVGGVENGEPRLFETDPSGTPYEWQATAVGGGRDDIQSYLEDNYEDDLSLEDGIGLALEALAEASDDGLTASGVEMTAVPVDTEQVRPVEEETLAEHIEDRDLGGEDDA
ncbi:archaeal proteasome endopeptidase complex subunit alpha [Halapricum hydrolyticum]|uniref:Proteasome subunit alpha n=1 Tax=Halapricum hydrolyticum TaxID=2979991 RepID=A0AAE3IHI9_9EURY|nr:archaeal proteasome endopeptidase complex subunit alpha [Halapricum hydrolyticum]MCU4719547.1 archaeal proteasome endopeptidase complex subunit alpha [Halapricum hydrolyticum]MCU4728510.1 archaeal proteasome endopeptidase complex subunit alpha [Halapricum hydrolyticum]